MPQTCAFPRDILKYKDRASSQSPNAHQSPTFLRRSEISTQRYAFRNSSLVRNTLQGAPQAQRDVNSCRWTLKAAFPLWGSRFEVHMYQECRHLLQMLLMLRRRTPSCRTCKLPPALSPVAIGRINSQFDVASKADHADC